MAQLPLGGAVITGASFVAVGFSGIVFLRRLVPAISSPVDLCIWGAVFGMACGRISLTLAGLCIGPSFLAASLALGILPCAAFLLMRLRPHPRLSWDAEEWHELSWILGFNAAVLLAMALPYWGVGHLTSKGYAFVAHFGWDFFNHLACTAELARSVPPQNPYFAGEPFHYYWLSYAWPAAVVNLSGVTARDALVLTLPPTVLLFIGALNCLVRLYVPRPGPRYLAVTLGLLAFSYIGLLFTLRWHFAFIATLMSRAVNPGYSYLSHSWFRDFLYEPHSVAALTPLLMVLFLEGARTDRFGQACSLISGLLLGLIPLTDMFVGMIGLLWFAGSNMSSFLIREESRRHIISVSLVSLVVLLGGFALQFFPLRTGALHFRVHPMLKIAPAYLLVELGPIFVFGAVGLYQSWRRGRTTFYGSMFLLMLMALVLGFTLVIPFEPNVVIRKAIKVVQVPLVVYAAIGCMSYLEFPLGHWIRLSGVPLILAGFLTLCTDIYQYTDLERERVSGTSTTYISLDKMRALEWIRQHTASDAIVQVLDEVRPGRNFTTDYDNDISVSALGERRTFMGNYKLPHTNHVDDNAIERRTTILERVFRSKDPNELKENLNRLPPHYLFVEWDAPGPTVPLGNLMATGYLEEVFHCGKISVLLKRPS
jgi:hypothetical protein